MTNVKWQMTRDTASKLFPMRLRENQRKDAENMEIPEYTESEEPARYSAFSVISVCSAFSPLPLSVHWFS
jgi:hypothetical protein